MPSRTDPTRNDPTSLPLATRLRDRVAAVRRAVLRRRRLLAVVFTAAAVAAGLRAAAPPTPDTVELLVAARDLPAGAVVAADDVRPLDLPRDAVPASALDDPVGATLAAPLGSGEPVTALRVIGPDLAAAAPGTVALPVRLSDAGQAALLEVGDRIDLLATDPQAATTVTVAADVMVLAVPEGVASSSAGPDGALSGRLVVMGVRHEKVSEVTTASVTTFVTFSWTER